jgi:hypothetical protein
MRQILRRTCVPAAALISGAFATDAAAQTTSGNRIAVFRAAGFPTVDAPVIAAGTLDQALAGSSATAYGTAQALADALRGGQADVLLLPYGSAFPVEAWPAIRGFVEGGGGLVVLGGAPFAQPVRTKGGAFVPGTRQPTYAHDLLIGPFDVVAKADIAGPAKVAAVEGSGWTRALPEPTRTFALTVRLATRKDMPSEHGSEGPKDAVVRPLVHVVDRDGIPRACPLLVIDRLRGREAGGRWVLAPSDAPLDAAAIRDLVALAVAGAAQVEARPVGASVAAGETPQVRVVATRPRPRAGEPVATTAHLRVTSDGGAVVHEADVALAGTNEIRAGLATLPAAAKPALYRVAVTVPGAAWPNAVTTGFWVKDDALLAAGPRLSVSRDWLRADGQVFPIVGATYMASDVHRKFLFEPNPHVWDRDFAQMRASGINLVRTGIWTAWSRAMLDPGVPDENVLAALDAYVQTAARHRIVVCFTFFAFQPPAYGGTNPFLDERSLEGQRAFLTLVASRYRGVPWVHWDLINEPSYSPADQLWTNRPVRDGYERRAWAEFLRKRHGDDAEDLRDAYRMTGDGADDLPSGGDFGWQAIRESRVYRRVHDFNAFSQEAVRGWASRLTAILKAAGGPGTLVTLGQDEGGTQLRPAQQLHYDAVDYTAVHTWWANDDLLWDGVVTKVPEVPNVHQETGLMRLEDGDGNPWRTPEEAARLLERKLAYAFASRGAGVVQWAWNINPYQPIDNESVIGIYRPDGTAKTELRAMSDFAGFLTKAAPYLDDFAPDTVVMVIPHARLFSQRPGDLAATRRVVRMLGERFGVVPTALSDQRVTAERLAGAKLVLVPAPEMLDEPAARALLAASKAGALVVVTGAVEGDAYGRVGPALRELGLVGDARALVQHERTIWGGGWATFDDKIGEVVKRSTKAEPRQRVGYVWHEPLPIEFAREPAVLAGFLEAVLKAAGIATHPTDTRVVARVLEAPKASLVVCVNETAEDAARRVTIEGRPLDVVVPAGRARLVLVERATGKVLAATPGGAVRPGS